MGGAIQLTPRQQEQNYIQFVASNNCQSYVGMVGGAQSLWVSADCQTGDLIHEASALP